MHSCTSGSSIFSRGIWADRPFPFLFFGFFPWASSSSSSVSESFSLFLPFLSRGHMLSNIELRDLATPSASGLGLVSEADAAAEGAWDEFSSTDSSASGDELLNWPPPLIFVVAVLEVPPHANGFRVLQVCISIGANCAQKDGE